MEGRVDRKGAKKEEGEGGGGMTEAIQQGGIEYKQGFKFIFNTASFWFWYQGGREGGWRESNF